MQLTLYHQLSDVPPGSSGIGMSMYSDSMGDNITLDTGSTMSIFGNSKIVENIRKSPTTMEMLTNAGTRKCTEVADVPGFGQV